MTTSNETQLSQALDIDISMSISEIQDDKHKSGKQALSNSKYALDGYTSISHSLNFAVGVSTPIKPDILGIGVDFEEPRKLDVRASKMFLTKDEISKLNSPSSELLVGLWTIKEALFKSTPDNNGLFLRNFEITEKNATVGNATCQKYPEFNYRFATLKLPNGILSVAICLQTADS